MIAPLQWTLSLQKTLSLQSDADAPDEREETPFKKGLA